MEKSIDPTEQFIADNKRLIALLHATTRFLAEGDDGYSRTYLVRSGAIDTSMTRTDVFGYTYDEQPDTIEASNQHLIDQVLQLVPKGAVGRNAILKTTSYQLLDGRSLDTFFVTVVDQAGEQIVSMAISSLDEDDMLRVTTSTYVEDECIDIRSALTDPTDTLQERAYTLYSHSRHALTLIDNLLQGNAQTESDVETLLAILVRATTDHDPQFIADLRARAMVARQNFALAQQFSSWLPHRDTLIDLHHTLLIAS